MEHLSGQIESPDDEGLKLAYRNKEFAAFMGAPGYSAALEEYEFMQTVCDKSQREWRITQHLPFYSLQPKQVPNPKGWGHLYFKKFDVSDVEFLICPSGKAKVILGKIPKGFRSVRLVELLD